MSSSSSRDTSQHTRPYTVGFTIAAVLIFFLVVVHLSRFIFRKIKKYLNGDPVELVITETPAVPGEERKLSTHCYQQLELILKVEDEVSSVSSTHKQKRPFLRSNSENVENWKMKRNQSRRSSTVNRTRKLGQSLKQPNEIGKVTFFAGYSHRHVYDE